MTRDEILNMPAGREMDGLVGYHVMGVRYDTNKNTYLQAAKYYSSDISEALEVTEKLAGEWDFALLNNQNFGEYPDLHYGFRLQAIDEDSHIKTIFALGETAPLAICRAALLAVMK